MTWHSVFNPTTVLCFTSLFVCKLWTKAAVLRPAGGDPTVRLLLGAVHHVSKECCSAVTTAFSFTWWKQHLLWNYRQMQQLPHYIKYIISTKYQIIWWQHMFLFSCPLEQAQLDKVQPVLTVICTVQADMKNNNKSLDLWVKSNTELSLNLPTHQEQAGQKNLSAS